MLMAVFQTNLGRLAIRRMSRSTSKFCHCHVPDDHTSFSGKHYPTERKSLDEEDEEDHRASDASLREDSPEDEVEFDQARCLFCNHINSSLDDNLTHMLKIHGLFIPDKDHLVVDVETLIAYMHLIIFGYFQCLYCGTLRGSAEAIQQHMIGKSHCKFDISSEDSEFQEFYAFDSDHEEEDEEVTEASAKRSTVPFMQSDDTSALLPSGKVLSHRSSRSHRHQQHNRPNVHRTGPRLNPIPSTHFPTPSDSSPSQSASRTLTKVEKRDAAVKNQLLHVRASDLKSLVHLPTSQQHALLATQKKQMDKARKAERRMQSRVDGMGNKTLMKHFVPDVPGPKNG